MADGGIGKIKTEVDLERFIMEKIEQLPLNKIQGLAPKLADHDARLKKGGL